MSKANPTTGERMVLIENKIDNIEKTNEAQYKLLNRIETKLDDVIQHKAEKTTVDALDERVAKITWQLISGLVVVLIAVLGFLLRYTLFRG